MTRPVGRKTSGRKITERMSSFAYGQVRLGAAKNEKTRKLRGERLRLQECVVLLRLDIMYTHKEPAAVFGTDKWAATQPGARTIATVVRV